MLEPEGLAWIEEPTLAHDFAGRARVASEVATPIQLGENWWGPPDVAKASRPAPPTARCSNPQRRGRARSLDRHLDDVVQANGTSNRSGEQDGRPPVATPHDQDGRHQNERWDDDGGRPEPGH